MTIPARLRPADQDGFTLPELMAVMVITVMFSFLIVMFMFDFWSGTATLENDSENYVARLNAGDILRDAINESTGLINQNGITDSNTGYPDPAYPSNLYWNPIHAVPGNIANGANGTYTPVLYFRRPAVDTSKTFIMNGTVPYENEYVLYLNNSNKQLLIRTLANSAATGNKAKTSCPPASATSSCPADKIVADNIASVDLRYFSKAGNTIDYHASTDPNTGNYNGPDYPSVEVVEFNLHSYKKSALHGGQDTSSQNVIRIALRNS
jgi:prepilin-type N-terminal cleavage/methylation domain-containing protein